MFPTLACVYKCRWSNQADASAAIHAASLPLHYCTTGDLRSGPNSTTVLPHQPMSDTASCCSPVTGNYWTIQCCLDHWRNTLLFSNCRFHDDQNSQRLIYSGREWHFAYVRKNVPNDCEFHENWRSKSHNVLTGVNMCLFSTVSVWLGWYSTWDLNLMLMLNVMRVQSFTKIDAGMALLSWRSQTKCTYLCLYVENAVTF